MTNTDTNVSTTLTTNSSGFYEAPMLIARTIPGNRGGARFQEDRPLEPDARDEGSTQDRCPTGGRRVERIDHHHGRISHSRHQHGEHGKGADHPRTDGPAHHDERHCPDGARGARGGEPGDDAVSYTGTGRRIIGLFRPLGLGQNEWSIDGAPNLGSGGIAFTPFTDQIAEYKIETTSFDASVGHSIGLNIAFSTKSGTNTLHGSATEQYWNTRWNAASFFVKQKYFQNIDAANAAGNSALANQLASQPMQPGGHANDYGFTLGGPVYIPKVLNGKNKLFWFFSYSGNKTRQPARCSEITNTVPTMAERQGNFSDLLAINSKYQIYDPLSVTADPARPGHYIRTPIPGNIIPQNRILDPTVVNWYTSRIPAPNNNPSNPLAEPFNNFLALGQADNVNYTGLASRDDWAPDLKNRFSFSWNWSHFHRERAGLDLRQFARPCRTGITSGRRGVGS